ncbi:MAG: hypothetical protein RR100_04900 [Comamonas sp.]
MSLSEARGSGKAAPPDYTSNAAAPGCTCVGAAFGMDDVALLAAGGGPLYGIH